jgi:hypothetical protein
MRTVIVLALIALQSEGTTIAYRNMILEPLGSK